MYSVINWTLKTLRLVNHDIPWLPDPYLAMLAVILVNTWRGLPFFAVTTTFMGSLGAYRTRV